MTIHDRPYQADLTAAIRAAWDGGATNVLAQLPTGGGKTVVFAGLLHDLQLPSVAIAHRKELVGQMAMALARREVPHRVIGPLPLVKYIIGQQQIELGRSWYSPTARCAVASVNTLVNRADELRDWLPQVRLWVQDECFPAGTLVDGRAIESLRPGDMVTAFDETSGMFERRPVVRLFDNPMPDRMVRIHIGAHRTIRATFGHPFWTRRGWVEAGSLTLADEVLCAVPVRCWQPVRRVDPYQTTGNRVYNIEVSGLHTYIADGVVVHNCHHVLKRNMWGKACSMFPNARGLGVTATPHRADGHGLGSGEDNDGVFDTMVQGPSMRWLIDEGYLTDYDVLCPPNDLHLEGVEVSDATGDYKPEPLKRAVRASHVTGDVVQHYVSRQRGKLGVVFATDVETATDIAAQFRAAGVKAEVLSAESDARIRDQVVRDFRARKVEVLVNVDLFGEGFDLPALEVVMFVRPTKSLPLHYQQFGRGLRPMYAPGMPLDTTAQRLAAIAASCKPRAVIHDHVGNVFQHGLPDARRNWTLARRERGRRNATDPDVIPLRPCPGCTRPYERFRPACPYCGHTPVPTSRSGVEFVDGDLTLLDATTLARLRAGVDATDSNGDDAAARMRHAGAPDIAVNGMLKQHRMRQDAQTMLREQIKWWAGVQKRRGLDLAETYRMFYITFGTDILSAQALGRPDASALAERIALHMGANP